MDSIVEKNLFKQSGLFTCLKSNLVMLLANLLNFGFVISNSLFKHWLDTTPHKINPVKLIAEVLNYSRKNKYPSNRSALTYWEENFPLQFDLGMQKYGGPFSEEKVQNVKTILRLTPL